MAETQAETQARTDTQEKPAEQSAVRVFVVQTQYASPNRIDSSQELSDMKREIDFTYPKNVRNKISAIREKHMGQIRDKTVDFPPEFKNPLHLCNESQKKEIREITASAETDFQKLAKNLHAEVIFLELNIHDVQRGELYGQVISAIRYKIMYELIEKIGEKAGQLPDKSKNAMLNLIERLKSVNVLNDPEVDLQLKTIREKILTDDIAAVKAELTKDLSFTKQRMAYINL
ncbi:MAG: hypothetical protein PHW62_00850 [Candidatus Ratteibacteria bacterium]|nr:hypothetical protein [Candidatus Ratteibacteria bacterium]